MKETIMTSPTLQATLQTPEWMLDIHAYDAIEIHPLQKTNDDYELLDRSSRGCHWGVHLHLKTGGIENVAVFESQHLAAAEKARLLQVWPHLSGPWELTQPESHASATIRRSYDNKPVARVYDGDAFAHHIVTLHNSILKSGSAAPYHERLRQRAVVGTAITNQILGYAVRTQGTAVPHGLLPRLLGMLVVAQNALDAIADKVVLDEGETVSSLDQLDIDDIYSAAANLLADIEPLIIEAEAELAKTTTAPWRQLG